MGRLRICIPDLFFLDFLIIISSLILDVEIISIPLTVSIVGQHRKLTLAEEFIL